MWSIQCVKKLTRSIDRVEGYRQARRLAEFGTEQLDFLNGIANEIREPIHGCAGLNQ